MENTLFVVLIYHIFGLSLAFGQGEKARLIVESGHSDGVEAIAFSPNGKILASGAGSDENIKLWDTATGQELITLDFNGFVESVAFSPDGGLLAVGGSDLTNDESIVLWDVATGQKWRAIKVTSEGVKGVSSVKFSPDGSILASGNDDGSIRIWDVITGKEINKFSGHSDKVTSIVFGSNGSILASGSWDKTIRLWDVATGKVVKTLSGHNNWVTALAMSPNDKFVVSADQDAQIKIWDVASGAKLREFKDLLGAGISAVTISPDSQFVAAGVSSFIWLTNMKTGQATQVPSGHANAVYSLAFGPIGSTLASGSADHTIKIWDFTARKRTHLKSHASSIREVVFKPDGTGLASGEADKNLTIWSWDGPIELKTLKGHTAFITSLLFSPDAKRLFSGSGRLNERYDKTIKIWDVASGQPLRTLAGHTERVVSLALSPDGKTLASGSKDKSIILWDIETGQKIRLINTSQFVRSVAFTSDGQTLASGLVEEDMKRNASSIQLWDVTTGQPLKTLKASHLVVTSIAFSADGKTIFSGIDTKNPRFLDLVTGKEIRLDKSLDWVGESQQNLFKTSNGKFVRADIEGNKIVFRDDETERVIISLIAIDETDWIVAAPDGRFDTNKPLDKISGLHWAVNDEILKPVPLDVFMRQYYEPGLLKRVLKCNEESNCGQQFKPLPSIAEINRVQPKVAKPIVAPTASGLADVTVELSSVTEDVTIDASNRSKTKKLTSGVYDLRLFRDGQLIGTSASSEANERYIAGAPEAVEKDRITRALLNTEEDKLWRDANVIIPNASGEKASAGGNCSIDPKTPTKAICTFKNVKLPRDGRTEVEFTAYVFNSDRVKSDTATSKYTLPAGITSAPARKGRAFVISIGVNASENPAYNLQYAGNDARNMQAIIGERLNADKGKYSDIVQVPLISDLGKDGTLSENNAQKAIIKGVFSLLAGNEKEVPADILKQIPNRDKIKAVEPEDTLIITYAGHGYADQAGIFYLLPYDIGKEPTKLSADVLRKTISSDELSLWMLGIAATEMIMIIDACHSSAAVQGDGFKPGPMGSRGLGQLAYDKGMKILSATQANNVALELGSLQQGLLSYALLQDGIKSGFADANKDKQLSAIEWLSYAEKRVPELYQEVKDGKRGVRVDGREVKDAKTRADLVGKNQNSSLNLQQPALFDFRKRNLNKSIFVLP